MFTLVRKLFWFGLFLVFTLGFVTWFDHGFVTSKQFTADAKSEVGELIVLWHSTKHPPDKSQDSAK